MREMELTSATMIDNYCPKKPTHVYSEVTPIMSNELTLKPEKPCWIQSDKRNVFMNGEAMLFSKHFKVSLWSTTILM